MRFLYFDSFIWSLIPFRQAGKKYFYFFYSLAFADPVTALLRVHFHSGTNLMYAPSYFLALVSLQSEKLIKKYRLAVVFILFIICAISLRNVISEGFIMMSIINFLILISFLGDFMKQLMLCKSFNIF